MTNLVWKSFNPLIHHAMNPLMILLARTVLLVILAVDAARLVASAPATSENAGDPSLSPA
jgi:hypothetical protein